MGSPFRDVVLFLIMLAFFFIVSLMMGMSFLTPLLLGFKSFGLRSATTEDTQQRIATTFGLTQMPFGICNLLVGVFLFLPLTRRVGTFGVIVAAGCVAAVCYLMYGFFIEEVWQVVVLNGAIGVCFGFL